MKVKLNIRCIVIVPLNREMEMNLWYTPVITECKIHGTR